MGVEWLEYVAGLLSAAGLRAGEEYPAGERMEVLSPVAAVGLRELDCAEGLAWFTVRVLSPRILGGWCCQTAAAKAAAALSGAGLQCQTGEMDFLSGSDCFCVTVTARMEVSQKAGVWSARPRWEVLCGGVLQTGVASFAAERDLNRRVVGAFCQSEPVAVSSGRGGWRLTLVQDLGRAEGEPETPEEPFELVVWQEKWASVYSGCCWNSTRWEHTPGGLRLTRQGFALGREVSENG